MTVAEFPFEPLLVTASIVTGHPAHPLGKSGTCTACPTCVGIGDLATWAGVSRRTMERWMQRRGLPLHLADRIVTELGRHPCEVWPDQYQHC